MISKKKRLISTLCTFAISGANLFAVPVIDWLDIAGGVISKLEGNDARAMVLGKKKSNSANKSKNKVSKGRKGKKKGKKKPGSKLEMFSVIDSIIDYNTLLNLCRMIKCPYALAVSMLQGHELLAGCSVVGAVCIEKSLEPLFNQFFYPLYLEKRYPSYRVLARAFNLGGEKAESVLKVVDKVDSIGRGFNNFVKYFDNDNPPKNLDNFSTCYDNVVFICYVISLHYQQGGYKDKDVVTRFYEMLKRLVVPLKAKRKSCRFDKEAEKSTENDMTDINHYLKKPDGRPWYEFGFLGYDEPVDQFCNISMLEEWLASAFTANSEDSKAFRKRFDDLNNDGTAKAVGITKTDNKSWVIRCDGGKLNFESTKAKVAGVAGTSNVTFTIPDGKDKISGNDLLEVAFKKDG